MQSTHDVLPHVVATSNDDHPPTPSAKWQAKVTFQSILHKAAKQDWHTPTIHISELYPPKNMKGERYEVIVVSIKEKYGTPVGRLEAQEQTYKASVTDQLYSFIATAAIRGYILFIWWQLNDWWRRIQNGIGLTRQHARFWLTCIYSVWRRTHCGRECLHTWLRSNAASYRGCVSPIWMPIWRNYTYIVSPKHRACTVNEKKLTATFHGEIIRIKRQRYYAYTSRRPEHWRPLHLIPRD